MADHPLPAGARFVPELYVDETTPPPRKTPSDWVEGSAAEGWSLSAGYDGEGLLEVVEGEVVAFHAVVDLATVTLTVAFDEDSGRIWHSDPPGPFVAPPGFSLSVSDGVEPFEDLAALAYELDPGEHEGIAVYAWTDTPRRYRFTEGRFEPVREDA